MKAYISGPITGREETYEAAFEAAADVLMGDDRFSYPINPVTIGRDLKDAYPDATWADYMRADIKALCDCDAIVMLPGWMNSRGAKVEQRLAFDLGLKAFIYDPASKAVLPRDQKIGRNKNG